MFLVMAVTLYTSRIILQSLGIENYGIYSVVGGVIGLLAFVNSSMSLSVQRHLSFELGRNDIEKTGQTFGISILIHIIIALIIGTVMLTFSGYITEGFLNIPNSKRESTAIFFRFIILSTCLNILQVPFMGLIIAFEKMTLLAWISVVEVILKLIIAFAVMWIPLDSLVVYGLLLSATSFVTLSVYWIVCRLHIRDIKFLPHWNTTLFRNLMSFASWSALGEIAWAFTIQGVSVLLNHFAGVACNAGYGIASQISGAVNKFVSSFQTALNPQIIKQYASKEIDTMLILTFRGIRLSFFLILLLGIPLINCMDTILHLWLGIVPDYTVTFSRLIIISVLLDSLSNLLATIAKAYGHIRHYQIVISSVLILNFPLSWLALRAGFPPYTVIVVYSIISIALLFVRLRLISIMLHHDIRHRYMHDVLRQVIIVSILSAALFTILSLLIEEGVFRLFLTSILSLIIIPAMVFQFGLDKGEKRFVIEKIKSVITTLRWNIKSV